MHQVKSNGTTKKLAEISDVSCWPVNSTAGVTTFEPGVFYALGTITALTYALTGAKEGAEWNFSFNSGKTAATVTHPSGVNIGDFEVAKNVRIEVSIRLEGGTYWLAWKAWE